MPTNPYFNHYTDFREQQLVEDLVEESIQLYGLDMVYLPRKFRNLDLVYGEDPVSKFEKSFDLEMYIKNVDGFQGDGEFLSKFGLEIREQATFTISQRRFHEVVSKEFNGKRTRPHEGDLIWLPMNNSLFHINFVNPKSVFFQLGELYVYDLNVEVYEWSHKELDTKIPEIDQIAIENANTIALNLDVGLGDFKVGEEIFQGPSLAAATAKAKVAFHDVSNNVLLISNRTGKFSLGTNVVGVDSSASWFVSEVDNLNNPNDVIDDSKIMNKEAEIFVDFDEEDPFSEEL